MVLNTTNDMFSIDSIVATRRGSFFTTYRGLKPTAKVIRPLRGRSTAEHVAATADISALIRQGMIIVRILEGIVKNKYAANPGKLAAWLSASHVEKAPKKKDPPTP